MLPLLLTAVLIAEPPSKLVFDEILNGGVAVPGGPKVKLPRPVVATDADAAARKKAVAWLRGQEGKDVEEKEDRARYYYKNKTYEGKQPYHVVTTSFIAYGTLDRLEKGKLLEELLGAEKAKKAVELSDAELKARKIERVPKKAAEERYAVIDTTLDKDVRITGVMRNQTVKGKRQITVTSVLDDRFIADKDHPNRFRKITEKDGKLLEGKALPYAGFGGYARVTELDDPKGALFVEMVFLYHEPKEWYGGRGLLVPKLKLAVDDNVIRFRRSLKARPSSP